MEKGVGVGSKEAFLERADAKIVPAESSRQRPGQPLDGLLL